MLKDRLKEIVDLFLDKVQYGCNISLTFITYMFSLNNFLLQNLCLNLKFGKIHVLILSINRLVLLLYLYHVLMFLDNYFILKVNK